jgi:hypothetical protein
LVSCFSNPVFGVVDIVINAGFPEVKVIMLSKGVLLNVGETALLTCVGMGVSSVEISWSFNGAPVANTSLITIYKEDLIQRTSFLQLCSVNMSDAGSYGCIASDGVKTASAVTEVTVTG